MNSTIALCASLCHNQHIIRIHIQLQHEQLAAPTDGSACSCTHNQVCVSVWMYVSSVEEQQKSDHDISQSVHLNTYKKMQGFISSY